MVYVLTSLIMRGRDADVPFFVEMVHIDEDAGSSRAFHHDGLEFALFIGEGLGWMAAIRDEDSLDLGQRGERRNSVRLVLRV